MREFQHATATNSKPTVAAAGTVGYCKDGTPGDPTSFTTISIGWMNDLIDEVKALATNAGEVALDPTNTHQINDRLAGAAMLKSGPAGTTVDGVTLHTKGNIAGGRWDVVGDDSLTIGCGADITGAEGSIDGIQSLAIRSYGSHIAGTGSILMGAYACELVDDNTLAGGVGTAPCAKDGLTNKGIKWYLDMHSGAAGFADVVLTADKSASRIIPLSSATPVKHANAWEFKDGTLTNGLGWIPMDPSATNARLIIGLPLRAGEKLDVVHASIVIDPSDTGKVYGNLYKKAHTGAATKLLAVDIEWSAGHQGRLQLQPDTPDPVVDENYQYWLELWVTPSDSINKSPYVDQGGLDHVRMDVLLTEL